MCGWLWLVPTEQLVEVLVLRQLLQHVDVHAWGQQQWCTPMRRKG